MDKVRAQNIGATCLALHVRRAARQVARIYDQALRPVGLSNGQFSLLTMLAAKADWEMQPLADALGADQSSLTAAIKPLKRRGLVEARADDKDRRVRRLALTRSGDQLLDRALPLWGEAQGRAEAAIESASNTEFRNQLLAFS